MKFIKKNDKNITREYELYTIDIYISYDFEFKKYSWGVSTDRELYYVGNKEPNDYLFIDKTLEKNREIFNEFVNHLETKLSPPKTLLLLFLNEEERDILLKEVQKWVKKENLKMN